MRPLRPLILLALLAFPTLLTVAGPSRSESPEVTILLLGDSITKGVRPGVRPEETFGAILERALKAEGIPARVVNLGVGGERTDQALRRLDAVAEHHPWLVTVMYGTNDSYIDPGQRDSRLRLDDYRANLRSLVADLRRRGIEPILMTEPRWAADAPPNGLGENPNVRLTPYMAACRDVASASHIRLVDHFARWTEAESRGQSLRDWTTDGCHPNPRGHRELADAIWPVLLDSLQSPPRDPSPTR